MSLTRPPRRSAFLVGINYNNTSSQLNGCYNDIVNVYDYLTSYLGYTHESISYLTDGNRTSKGIIGASSLLPTRQNIIDGFTTLVSGMVAGDEAVFHYSGHGSLVRDTNGDEVSGFDSCICPIDYNVSSSDGGGIITDDDIRSFLVNKVPRGARLYIILDCCHNGTGCDIRYKYEDYSVLVRKHPMPIWRTLQRAYLQSKYTETDGNVFMISGSRDEQTSADAYINNAFAGALTYAVFSILRANQSNIRTYSWSILLRDVRQFMRENRYTQIPQIMTGRLIYPSQPVFSTITGTGRTKFINSSRDDFINPGYRSISTINTVSFITKNSKIKPRHSIQFIH